MDRKLCGFRHPGCMVTSSFCFRFLVLTDISYDHLLNFIVLSFIKVVFAVAMLHN